MSEKKVPTIYDVARAAGVARATVDRVIYKRGIVSPDTREKVLRAIDKLGYTANINASRLASKRTLVIAVLIPRFKEGDYWSVIYRGFQQGARAYKVYDVRTEFFLYDADDVASFLGESDKVLQARPDGVITNVVFAPELRQLAARLAAADIPLAYVDQKLDGTGYQVYCGADPAEGGFLSAFLLTHRTQVREMAMVRLIRDNGANPNKVRREGILNYIGQYLPDCKVHTVFVPQNDPALLWDTLDRFATEHPGVHHYLMSNSRVHLLGDWLRAHPDPQRSVVGFDDLEKNITLLQEGLVEYLVVRHIPMQAYYTIARFIHNIIGGGSRQERDLFMHNDILHRYNLNNYKESELNGVTASEHLPAQP